MKSLDKLTKSTDNEFTGIVMETVMMLMRVMRREMRRHQPAELTMTQFRTMRILRHHPDISLSHLAEHMDITHASASTLIDVLVKHSMVSREYSAVDRRKIMIKLTDTGLFTLDSVWQATQKRLSKLLSKLNITDRDTVAKAMEILRVALDNRMEEGGC
ncbi:MAG: MarR family transcriptional regulator [bacterium]